MSTTIRCRLWLCILAAVFAAELHSGRSAPAQDVAPNRGFKIGRFRTGEGDHFVLAQLNGVTIKCADDSSADEAFFVTFSAGDLQQLIFGAHRDAKTFRERVLRLLDQRIVAVDAICGLSDSQNEKLRLAGGGDLQRLLDRAAQVEDRFGDTTSIRSFDEFEKWARALFDETEALRPALQRSPFEWNSLFAKTLKRTLSPEQAAEHARLPYAPIQALTALQRPVLLDEVLENWERFGARIGRVDCEFSRFRYDKTLEVEHRGEGSLAVDRLRRAVYEIGPAKIPAGAVSRKLSAAGAPFALTSETPERLHWTGNEVIPDSVEFALARPFLLGMPAADLRRHFDVTLVKAVDMDVWLEFVPKDKRRRDFWTRGTLILNAASYSPKALKTVDPTGAETVHVFRNVTVTYSKEGDAIPVPAGKEGLDVRK